MALWWARLWQCLCYRHTKSAGDGRWLVRQWERPGEAETCLGVGGGYSTF